MRKEIDLLFELKAEYIRLEIKKQELLNNFTKNLNLIIEYLFISEDLNSYKDRYKNLLIKQQKLLKDRETDGKLLDIHELKKFKSRLKKLEEEKDALEVKLSQNYGIGFENMDEAFFLLREKNISMEYYIKKTYEIKNEQVQLEKEYIEVLEQYAGANSESDQAFYDMFSDNKNEVKYCCKRLVGLTKAVSLENI